MTRSLRVETTFGPVWLPRRPADRDGYSHTHGDSELVIERRRIIGRIGWQRVTMTFTVPDPIA